MSACQEVRIWITEKIRKPVEKFIEQTEESCSKARRWVKRTIRKPITRYRVSVQRRCKRKKCKWWCACCNKWSCWIRSILLRFTEWIVQIVGEWLVETICKIVVRVVKIIVESVVTVARFIIVGTTCLVTNPIGVLDALVDLYYDIIDIIGDVAGLISDIVRAASELLDITREFFLDLGDMLGPIGRAFFGLWAGALDIARRLVDGARRMSDGLVDFTIGVLHLDFCSALEGLVNGVGFGALQAGLSLPISIGNGSRDAFVRNSLRNWLQEEIERGFDGDRQSDIDKILQMGSSSFGIHWPVIPLRCSISSRSNISLRDEHQEGKFNLYEIAGYAPFGCKEKPINRSVYQLVYKDTNYRVSLGDLKAYINEGPEASPEFVLIAGDKQVFRDMLQIAKRKMRQMAIHLDIEPLGTFEIQQNEIFLEGTAEPLASRITNDLNLNDICDLPSVLVFGYSPQLFGLASAFWDDGQRVATAATVRTSFMSHLFGTVLAHEMGHCFSLTHEGHNGVENIMYSRRADDLDMFTQNTFIEYVLLGGEPNFTLQDGKNAWQWILAEAIECLAR